MNAPGPAIRITGDHNGTADPHSVQDHTWNKERFPVVNGIEIVGEHPEADGIQLVKTMQCTIQNVAIRNCRYGIHLFERNRNVLIADSHIYDGGDSGIFMDNCNLHQMNIIGNHISYNKRAGIRQDSGDIHNIQITGNDIEYNAGMEDVSSGEIVLEATEGLISEYTIASNTIQARPEHIGANILITGTEADSPLAARTITITGNVIGSRDKNIQLTNAARVTITGNIIYGGKVLNVHMKHVSNVVLSDNSIGSRPTMHGSMDVYDDGILIEYSKDSSITGNILTGHRYGDEHGGGAITLRDATFCRIADNQIIAPQVRGIHIEGGQACTISDNAIDQRDAAEMIAAIAVTGEAQDHLIQHNMIRTSLEEPIIAVENTTLQGNTIVLPGK
jgi:nitrous oxidase accessory protein NosD